MRYKQQITEMLKQKKTNSRTPVGPTRARASGTKRLLKSLEAGAVTESEARPAAVQQRGKQSY